MVVQSVGLPKASGAAPEPELAVAPTHGRSFRVPMVLVPLLVATQVAWLALLGYGALRILH